VGTGWGLRPDLAVTPDTQALAQPARSRLAHLPASSNFAPACLLCVLQYGPAAHLEHELHEEEHGEGHKEH